MNDEKRFTSHVVLITVTTILLSLQRFLLIPILTKQLGPELYGVWAQISVTVALLAPLATLGLSEAVVRFLSGMYDKHKFAREYYSMLAYAAAGGILLSFGMYFLAFKFSLYTLGSAEYASYFQLAAALVIITTINIMSLELYRTRKRMRTYSVMSLIEALGEISVIFILLYQGYSITGAIIGSIAAKMVVLLLNVIIIYGDIRFKLPRFSIKEYLSFSFPLILIPLFTWIVQVSDQYVIGFYLGASAVGIYSLAYSLSFLIKLLYSPVLFVLQPTISEFWNRGNTEKLHKFIQYGYKCMMITGIGAAFGLITLSKPIITLFSTSAFLDGAAIIPIICAAFIFQIASSTMSQILTLLKKTKIIFNVFFIGSFINIALNIILVSRYGMLGAAIATLITFGFILVVEAKITLRYFKFRFMIYMIIKCLLSALVMSLFLMGVGNDGISIGRLFFHIILGAIVYVTSLYIFKAISKEEIFFLMKFFI